MGAMTMERKGWAIAAAVAVLIAVGLYFAGRWQGRSGAEAGRETLEARIATLTGERDRATAELASARQQIALLRARSLLFETALDLERRNFGTANQRLDAAAEQLAAAQAAGGAGPIESLRSAIADVDLRVAADLGEQRTTVLDFASRLDRIIGTPPAPEPARTGS